ncbi:homoserine acetyltransferase [Aliidiomarina minuta]|uniref:Probable acyltransferase n=1 Tax=Aliidiomarina minuta TaxID=880057 RepID=A0A432W4I4_9GAMM|nr:homoserine O-acetyltransferase [Aliidiomarina minuta]RUO24396.1 homoserine acetyltransferase [Aliidiomarina minuta]
MTINLKSGLTAGLMLLFMSFSLHAEWVEKRSFTTQDFELFNGQTLAEVKVGWQAYGELNEARDNVILITHFFSGNSHVAGQYEADGAIGYWDAIVGPGKAIDTDRFYVISVDTLVNQEPHNPKVITTGPATINPETNAPYGLDFPVVTIRDFVNVQKALLDELGIENLHAVIGASMGSLQAIDWAAAYPEKVERMVSVIGMAQADPWTVLNLQQWAEPILADPNWNKGDYYDAETPLNGLQQALMQISLQAMHPDIINATFPDHETLAEGPLHNIQSYHSEVNWLRERAAERALYADANHVLYLVRANQLFIAGMQEDLRSGLEPIQARSLFMPATNDLLLRPAMARKAHELLQELGKESQYLEIEGSWGHLDGIMSIESRAQELKEFLQ